MTGCRSERYVAVGEYVTSSALHVGDITYIGRKGQQERPSSRYEGAGRTLFPSTGVTIDVKASKTVPVNAGLTDPLISRIHRETTSRVHLGDSSVSLSTCKAEIQPKMYR
jgi:hypothetical protein